MRVVSVVEKWQLLRGSGGGGPSLSPWTPWEKKLQCPLISFCGQL